MSANATNAIPIAAGMSDVKSSNEMSGASNAGRPPGTLPTTGMSSARPRTLTDTVAPTTASKTPGNRGAKCRRTRISTSEPAPSASAVPFVSSSPTMKSRTPGTSRSGSMERPSSWGS